MNVSSGRRLNLAQVEVKRQREPSSLSNLARTELLVICEVMEDGSLICSVKPGTIASAAIAVDVAEGRKSCSHCATASLQSGTPRSQIDLQAARVTILEGGSRSDRFRMFAPRSNIQSGSCATAFQNVGDPFNTPPELHRC
jgi:hypothetical protein